MNSGQRTERQLLAILAADVVGYSTLMGRDEAGTLARLKQLRDEVFHPAIVEHSGRLVKLIGDGSLVTFQSVVDAVACAASIQRTLAGRVSGESGIRFRIGVNIGDVIIDGDDIYGDGVNIAARLESIADPGGVVVSENVYEQVNHKLELDFRSIGEQRLKNIAEPIRAYQLVFDGCAIPHRRSLSLRPRYPFLGLGVAGALLAACIGALQFLPWKNWPSAKPSILVLPFASVTKDPQHDYLADGIAADLITDLSKVSGLVVIARSSAFALKDSSIDPVDAAKRLNVRYVLTGSLRVTGDKLKVNVELVDGDTRSNVWADRFESRDAEFFQLQDNLVRSVVSSLSVRLTETEKTDISRLPTSNLEAYDFYTRAEQKAYSTGLSSLREILQLYQKAISLDPNFAEAHAG
ncbi:adenylate/guanylate cyclase domain-containing protein, partial [Nostoc sp. NIES-2111]